RQRNGGVSSSCTRELLSNSARNQRILRHQPDCHLGHGRKPYELARARVVPRTRSPTAMGASRPLLLRLSSQQERGHQVFTDPACVGRVLLRTCRIADGGSVSGNRSRKAWSDRELSQRHLEAYARPRSYHSRRQALLDDRAELLRGDPQLLQRAGSGGSHQEENELREEEFGGVVSAIQLLGRRGGGREGRREAG